ncbi:hypothetical protein CAP35_02275 [Chitinophagaceae bacterium IBVUCB1]|nr:hypothetical protein CAP35_02275 [Chitinophagaceae bacterium IBVUCB1]
MKRVLLICLVLLASAAFAQNNIDNDLGQPVVFRHLNMSHGLAGNTVSAILQDHKGFMWFGTDKGLNRYDGKNFELFVHNSKDTNSLSGNYVSALFEDRQGRIWIGTQNNGITIYNPVTQQFKRYEHDAKKPGSINTGYVAQIYEDSKGRFWICLYGGGLDLFDEKAQTFIHHVWKQNDPYCIAGIKCKSIYELSDDKYIVGTFEAGGNLHKDLRNAGGINYFDFRTNRFYALPIEEALINKRYKGSVKHMHRLVHTIQPDGSGNLWFGTYAGLLRYHIASKSFIGFKFQDDDPQSLSNDIVRSICQLNGKLYLATEGGGLSVLDTTTWKFTNYKNNPRNPNSLSDDFVRYIYKDRSSRIWIGTIGGGINIIDPPKQDFIVYPYSFLKIRPNNRVEDVTIHAMCTDGEGRILLGGSDGLTVLDTRTNDVKLLQKFRMFNSQNEAEKVQAIYPSVLGHFWVAYINDLWKYYPNKGQLIPYPYRKYSSRIPLNILSLTERNDTSLFANHFGKFTFVFYVNTRKTDSIINGINNIVVKDRNGDLWASLYLTPGDIVIKIGKDNKVTKLVSNTRTAYKDEIVKAMYVDAKNRLWIASNRRLDLLDIDSNKWFSYKQIKHLPDSSIRGMTEDGDGNMWFITSDALIKMNADNEITTYEPYRDMPVHKPEYKMVYDSYDDAVYFTANEGLVKFYPKRLRDKNTVPPIYVTGFKLFNKPVKADSSAFIKGMYHFAHDQNFITINYNLLNYTENVSYNYAYKLEGLNDDWVNIADKQEANFTNLNPGTYVFKVRASTRDGKYTSESLPLTIEIATPWWQSWWFYTACFLSVVAVTYSYNRYRTRTFEKRTRLLEKQVEERTIQYKEQKEKAEISERLRQQFLANMSHEIRTPMNAVNSFVNLLIEKEPKPEQVQYLTAISKSSGLLLHIINDVLDISKMDAGKLQLENIPFSLRQTITDVAETLSVLAKEKNLQLKVTVNDNVPDVIKGDPYRLSQVLLNLCNNSIKFTEKGYVSICVELAQEDSIKLIITDTGIGISFDKLKLLFRDFAQVNTSDTRIHGGTGLGLSISKGLVTLMGGSIAAESIPNVGSVFSFIIPLLRTDADETNSILKISQQIDGSLLNGLNILLVDDNEYNRWAVIDTLKLKADVTIDIATNGKEALDLLPEKEYDIILMDAQMPVMSGIEATKHIRKDFDASKRDIPIIAMTASVQHVYMQECLTAGMNVCITKPFNAQTLIKEIAILTHRTENSIAQQTTNAYVVKHYNRNVTNLAELSEFCEDDEKRMEQYINLYLKSVPAFYSEMEASLANNDIEKIKNLLHAFKPKCAIMGMAAALAIANSIEDNENVDMQEYMGDIQNFLKDVKSSVAELTEYMKTIH